MVSVAVAVSSGDVGASAIVDGTGPVADSASVVVSDTVVDVVADAIAVDISRAVSSADAERIELVCVAVAVTSGDVGTTTFVDGAGPVADSARVVVSDAVVEIIAETVTIGVGSVDPRTSVGTYVEPDDWNALVDDPDTLVIDTRNSYETAIGTFIGAIDPGTESFREFPQWAEQTLRPLVEQNGNKRIAMFRTGGIRCEKASSYLQQQGFGEVHHLRGGILKYLERVPEGESRWRGECFVFDQRVALNHQLEPGEYNLCHACGMPVSAEERTLPSYIKGVQCVHCVDRFSDADRERFAMRQRQMDQMQS